MDHSKIREDLSDLAFERYEEGITNPDQLRQELADVAADYADDDADSL